MPIAVPILLLEPAMLARSRERIRSGDPALDGALDQLRQDAEQAMSAGPFSVTFRATVAPSGDKHDYVSMGTYWWPDPASPNGLPYVRRDGHENPEIHAYDVKPLKSMCATVMTLALAWYFTGDPRFAARTAHLLRTWFLDPATHMNPHLRFAQFIPGRCEGRCIGLIDTVYLVPVFIDVLPLLATSDAWTNDDANGMVDWCKRYLDWLRIDPLGQQERAEHNNHGTGCDLQLAAFAMTAEQLDLARAVIEEAKHRRIDAHIAADGRQPHELKRTRSLSYSVFNLSMLVSLARLGERVGIDLWQHRTPEGASLASAIDFVARTATQSSGWPFEQVVPVDHAPLVRLLRLAGRATGDHGGEKYVEAIERDGKLDLSRERVMLTDPAPNH